MLSNNSSQRRLYFVLVTLLLILAASVHAQDAPMGGVLRISTNAPVELDPAKGSNDPEIMFNRALYDALVDVRPDSSIAPNLAVSWDISGDGLTVTFTLQHGVVFHDGSPFTSADVVYTFNRLVEIPSPATNLLGEFEVSAPDDLTVVFTLPSPNADFLYGVGSQFSGIVKDGTETPNVLAEGDNPYVNFNGTGPFVLQEYRAGDRAVLARNENYWWQGVPHLDGVEFIYKDDPIDQVNSLRNGEVDFIFKIPLDQLGVLEDSEGVSVLLRPTNQHPVIRIRSDEGHLGADVRVRQAFKLATDRQALNDILLEGQGVIGNNDPIGPLYGPFFTDAGDQTGQAYPLAACALLAEAGFPDGVNETLFTPDSFNYSDLATVLQQQWAEGCINVEIEVQPENVYYADDQWMQVELGITGWGSRPIPQSYFVEAYVTGGIYNESHFSDPEVDDLVAQAKVTADVDARAAIYAQISEIFAERGPIIIPYFAPMLGAASTNAQGLDEAFHPFPGLTDLRMVSVAG